MSQKRIEELQRRLKEAEEQLKNYHLQALNNCRNSINKICIVDIATGEIIFGNDSFIREFGDVKNKTCHQLFKNSDTPSKFCSRLNSGDILHCEKVEKMIHENKSKWYHIFDGVLPWSDGRPVRYLTFFDIDDLKIKLDSLNRKKWDEQVKALLKVGHWYWNPELDEAYCSDEIYELLGVEKKNTVLSRQFAEKYLHPDDMERVLESYEKTDGSADTIKHEYRVIKENGEICHIREIYNSLFDKNGNLIECFGTLHDITELKKDKDEVFKASELIRTLYRYTPVMLLITKSDEKRTIVDISDELCRRTGYPKEEVLGQSALSFLKPSLLNQYRKELLEDFLEKGYIENYEIQIVKKNRDFLDVYLSAANLENKSDQSTFRLVLLEDISKRKRTEIELKKKQKELIEKHTALNVLIDQYGNSKNEVEQLVIRNLNSVILPLLEEIVGENLTSDQLYKVEMVRKNLKNITKPFSKSLRSYEFKLTPTEIKVANAIRSGYSSKEIASHFNTTVQTIHFHRKNIRKKFGLINNGTNLSVFLSSIE